MTSKLMNSVEAMTRDQIAAAKGTYDYWQALAEMIERRASLARQHINALEAEHKHSGLVAATRKEYGRVKA